MLCSHSIMKHQQQLYVNDLIDVLSDDVIVKMYADDVKLYTNCMLSINDINPQLQSHLDKICTWAHEWQLPILYTKCNVLEIGKPSGAEYKMSSQTIVPVDNVVDLRVTIDNKLKFSDHINRIVCQAHKRANLIIRCLMSRDLSSLVRAFKVYVRPVVEYCSVVWNAHYMKDIVALERVQRRFTKRLPGMKALTYHQRLVKLRLESLEFRRIRLDLVFAYKVIFNLFTYISI